MVSIYSFGRQLSLPDIDEDDMDDEDVGIYLETACFKCQQFAKKSEALNEKVENLQILLSHREHHLKVCKTLLNLYLTSFSWVFDSKYVWKKHEDVKQSYLPGKVCFFELSRFYPLYQLRI